MDQAEALRKISREKGIDNKAKEQKTFQRVIAVASGKGGVGKTTVTVNLAVLMGQWGQRVLLLDADLGMANADILLDLQPRYTVMDVVKGAKSIEEVILDGPYNLKIIPGGSGLYELADLTAYDRDLFFSRLMQLEKMGDILFIDSAAGINRNVMSFVTAAEELVIVVTPEPTSITDAYGIIKTAASLRKKPSIKLVVNMVDAPGQGQDVSKRLQKACSHFLGLELEYLGEVALDPLVRKSIQDCVPYVIKYPNSKAAENLRRIGRRLFYQAAGEPETAPSGKKEGFFQKLKRMLN